MAVELARLDGLVVCRATTDDPALAGTPVLLTTADAGLVARQWAVFSAVAPQVGQRILVYNPFTDDYGWLDVAGVGLAAAP